MLNEARVLQRNSQIFDMKLAFWLLNPEYTVNSFEDCLHFYNITDDIYSFNDRLKSEAILLAKLYNRLEESINNDEDLKMLYYEVEIPLAVILLQMNFDPKCRFEYDLQLLRKYESSLLVIYSI